MEFWHVKVVADSLVNNQITEKERITSVIEVVIFLFIFLIMSLSISEAVGEAVGFTRESFGIGARILLFWGLPILLLFALDYYRKGKRFFERAINLARPLLVNMWLCIFAAQLVIDSVSQSFFGQTWQMGRLIWLILYILFFWRLNKWLKYTAQHKQS